jgi:DNA-binding NarL/FixJ family response regulator
VANAQDMNTVPAQTRRGVLICDERGSVRTALARVLSRSTSNPTEVSCVPGCSELLSEFLRIPAGLVMIGVQSGKAWGVDSTRQLLAVHPAAVVIVYGSEEDSRLLIDAVGVGARGLLLWDATRSIPAAGVHYSPAPGGTHASSHPRLPAVTLTERELQILRGMSQGYSNGEIGRSLFLSEGTVKTNARRLFQKLGANDRAHAVALSLRHDLVA